MVRLKDIAQRAGVSVMTVSKVLRDAPDISARTKVRVRALATAMGYVPDAMAQGLRSRKTRLLGLVIPSVTNPVFSRIVLAIEDLAREHGFDVILAHTINLAEREDHAIRRLIARRVDGLFISPVYRINQEAPAYQELIRRNIPTVLLGHRAPFCQAFPSVETDDLAGSQKITRHLIELGHRRIAFFAGQAVSPSAQERFEGYRRALREAGIELDEKLVYPAGSTVEEGEKAALQWLNEKSDATAVQAVNDMVAIGAGTVFLHQKLRIPGDLSLAGFGNVLISEHFRVPLTTIRQPKYRLGVAAMESMNRLLRREPVEPKRLPAEIILRESTAPPISQPVS